MGIDVGYVFCLSLSILLGPLSTDIIQLSLISVRVSCDWQRVRVIRNDIANIFSMGRIFKYRCNISNNGIIIERNIG